MSVSAAGGKPGDYRILSVIGIGHFMSHLYYLVLPPLFVHLRQAFDVSYAELGTALAMMALASAVVQVPVGFLVDRIGARVVLMAGLFIVATATALMGFATSYWQLLVLAVISGAGNAVFHPTDYAILNSSISPGRMGRAFSLHTFTGHMGSAAAPASMIALAQGFGWRTALVIAGLAGFVALVLLATQWNVMRDVGSEAKPTKGSDTETAKAAVPSLAQSLRIVLSPAMIAFFLFFTVLSMMQSGMQSFAVTALVALHDTPLSTANLALSVYLFASAAGVLIGGEISDRTSRHDLVAGLVFLFSGLGALAMGLFNLQAAVLIGLMALVGAGQGATRPARDMMLRAATPKGATGGVFGFVTSGIALGSALAPIPLGYLLDLGRPAWVFYLLAGFMGLALLSMLLQQALSRPR